MEFSFSASGWLFMYQLGVARVLQQSGLIRDNTYCTGSSGGALVSTSLLAQVDLIELKEYLLGCVDDCKMKPTTNSFKMRQYVLGAFELVKSKCDEGTFVHSPMIKAGQLGVSLTTLPNLKNHIITHFETQEELEEAILGSCTISPLAGFPFRLNRPKDILLHKQWVFDGGLSNIQPIRNTKNPNVITIAAFSKWDVDIKPSINIPISWGLHPPSRKEMDQLFTLGMLDAYNYLKANILKFPTLTVADLDSLYLNKLVLTDISLLKKNAEVEHQLSDKAVEISYKTFFKGMAFAAVYAEQSYLGAINLSKSAIIGLEKQRRKAIGPSKHGFSIRRWLPPEVIGSSRENLRNSLQNFRSLLDIGSIWGDLDEHKTDLVKNSYFIKRFG